MIAPAFLSAGDDLKRRVRGLRLTRQTLQPPPLAAFGACEQAISAQAQAQAQGDAEVADFVRRHADTIYQPADSCRMGPDPAQDVVDARLRVHGEHGVQGPCVVDALVMPRFVSGNGNAPVIMTAEKAAMFPGAGGRAVAQLHDAHPHIRTSARPHARASGRHAHAGQRGRHDANIESMPRHAQEAEGHWGRRRTRHQSSRG